MSKYLKPLPDNPLSIKKGSKAKKTLKLAAAVAIGSALLSACSNAPYVVDDNLKNLARNAQHPAQIAQVIEGMEVSDETFAIPANLQNRDGTIVLWEKEDIWGGAGAAVVYKVTDGVAIPLRVCPLPGSDITFSGKGDKHKIRNSIDDQTTQVTCETQEEANNRGRENPMLIVRGKSGGFFGLGSEEETFREFGVL